MMINGIKNGVEYMNENNSDTRLSLWEMDSSDRVFSFFFFIIVYWNSLRQKECVKNVFTANYFDEMLVVIRRVVHECATSEV